MLNNVKSITMRVLLRQLHSRKTTAQRQDLRICIAPGENYKPRVVRSKEGQRVSQLVRYQNTVLRQLYSITDISVDFACGWILKVSVHKTTIRRLKRHNGATMKRHSPSPSGSPLRPPRHVTPTAPFTFNSADETFEQEPRRLTRKLS